MPTLHNLIIPNNIPKYIKTIISNKTESYGVNYIGYFDEYHSIAETARRLAYKTHLSGIPFSIIRINSGSKKINKKDSVFFVKYPVQEPVYSKNIFICNANQIKSVYKKNKYLFKNKKNIGIWFWECETGFQNHADSYKYLNSVIVYTNYVKECISKYLPDNFPIHVKKYPFLFNDNKIKLKNTILKEYNIPSNSFICFFNFDFKSSYDRKNPEAVIRVFYSAFKNTNNTFLIIKTINMNKHNKEKNSLLTLINNLKLNDKVILIDNYLKADEMISLINSCTVYISLHRAEGLGLGLLEAMSLGKPVIAANYSGNLDFMNNDNSFLIDSKMIPVKTEYSEYKNVQYWAEPNEEQAAEILKKLYNNPELAESTGKKGREYIKDRYNIDNFKNDLLSVINP